VIPGSETGIVLYTPDGQEDRIGTCVNTSWEVDNVEKTYSELHEKGVDFDGPPIETTLGNYPVLSVIPGAVPHVQFA
jgi:hypothetical protein